jgi:hypothetical protein
MRLLCQNQQVFWPVVVPDPVFVVDILTRQNGTANKLRGNVSVLPDSDVRLIVNPYAALNVAVCHFPPYGNLLLPADFCPIAGTRAIF